jgi:hypothetical protein
MKMLADDENDSSELGVIGTLSDEMTTEALFWRLVCNLRLSPTELERWTLGDMRKADAYLPMQSDYKRAFYASRELQREDEEITTTR